MGGAIDVDPADPSKKTSEIVGPASDEATVQLSELDRKCVWNSVEFEQGMRVRTGGRQFECSYGKWVPVD